MVRDTAKPAPNTISPLVAWSKTGPVPVNALILKELADDAHIETLFGVLKRSDRFPDFSEGGIWKLQQQRAFFLKYGPFPVLWAYEYDERQKAILAVWVEPKSHKHEEFPLNEVKVIHGGTWVVAEIAG